MISAGLSTPSSAPYDDEDDDLSGGLDEGEGDGDDDDEAVDDEADDDEAEVRAPSKRWGSASRSPGSGSARSSPRRSADCACAAPRVAVAACSTAEARNQGIQCRSSAPSDHKRCAA